MAEQKTKTHPELIYFLIHEDGHIDSLLNILDDIARDFEPTEYGLPISEPERAMMRQAVLRWLSNLAV